MSSSSSSQKVIYTPRASSKRRSGGDPGRAGSLQLTSRPVYIPIPPSLIQSPYLLSPQSVFRRVNSTSQIPSQEDEEWLRDTVPLELERRDGNGDRAGLFPNALTCTNDEEISRERARNFKLNLPQLNAPSPPLVHWRLQESPSLGTKNKDTTLGGPPPPHDYFGTMI